MHLFNLSPVS